MTTCHQTAEGCARGGCLWTSFRGSTVLHCSVLSPEILGSESLHSSNLKQALIINFHWGLQTLSYPYLDSLLCFGRPYDLQAAEIAMTVPTQLKSTHLPWWAMRQGSFLRLPFAALCVTDVVRQSEECSSCTPSKIKGLLQRVSANLPHKAENSEISSTSTN